MEHSFLVICAIFPCLLFVRTLEPDFNREQCDPEEFYWPYAKVTKTRAGPTVVGLYESGFLDLRDHAGLLCINGPAFLYVQTNYNQFIEPEIQVFSHACVGFNRRKLPGYKDDFVALDIDTEVFGPKILGIYLLGAEGDFRRFAFYWFHDSAFAYSISTPSDYDIIDGSSFGMVSNDDGKFGLDEFEKPPVPNAMCFIAEANSTKGTAYIDIKSGDAPKFCYREEATVNTEFDLAFRVHLTAVDYVWKKCYDNPGPEEGIVDDMPKELPDFRIIDPSSVNDRGSPGKIADTKKTDTLNTISSGQEAQETNSPEYETSEESGEDKEKPLKAVAAELKECEELPIRPDPCGDDADEDDYCQVLKRVLQLNETDWTQKVVDAANPTAPPIYPLAKGSWRKSLFDIMTRIYQEACPQVSRALAPAIIRVVEYFIERIALDPQTVEYVPPNPPPPEEPKLTAGQTKFKILAVENTNWLDLALQLKTCAEGAAKMPFYRTRDKKMEQVKLDMEDKLARLTQDPNAEKDEGINRAEIEDTLSNINVRFPYRIWLPVGQKQIEIKMHVEVAEIDYNLDWVIDTFWKIFSTVMGYCLPHYTNKLETFKNLYTRFTDDIIGLMKEQWTQEDYAGDGGAYIFGDFQKIYGQIFGEFIHGVASRYIDCCMDGAYVHVEHPELRPPRPLYVKQGEIRPGATRPLNFFMEHPSYSKDNDDH